MLTMSTMIGGAFAADSDSTVYYNDFNKWRIGSYGEILATFKDYGLNRFYGGSKGNTKKNHNEISIPRFVLEGEYKITPKWILGAEIEFEAGGTGITYEIEAQSGSENGEYETEVEKGGEVALEQFHITRLIVPAFNIRAGHMIVPVGLTNAHHEPLNFFTAARPEGATTIMASTWHETGLAFFGQFGKGAATFDYEAMVTSGLNPNGFDAYNWIKKAKQGLPIKGKVNTAICYATVVEDAAIEQIRRMCDYEFTEGSRIRIMPDVHAGKGCTIGTTMTIIDRAVPNIVGVDIGCGMYTVNIGKADIDFEKFDAACHTFLPECMYGMDVRKDLISLS